MRYLFPRWCRTAGAVLSVSGIISACLFYIFDFKPKFLDIKVFAVFSYYFDKKYFSVIKNNAAEEVIILLILTGLFLYSFSRLANESEETVLVRIKSLFVSVYISVFILVLSVVFIYGLGFIAITVANCFSLLLINAVVFRIFLIRLAKKKTVNGSV